MSVLANPLSTVVPHIRAVIAVVKIITVCAVVASAVVISRILFADVENIPVDI
jgi:hypothetical protein